MMHRRHVGLRKPQPRRADRYQGPKHCRPARHPPAPSRPEGERVGVRGGGLVRSAAGWPLILAIYAGDDQAASDDWW